MKSGLQKAAGLALVLMLPVCFLQGPWLEAQTAGVIVRGRVLDRRGAPATRIKVMVGPRWGFTDSTGRYVLSRVPPGRYKVVLERAGKKAGEQDIEVKGPVTVRDLTWPFS